MNNFDVIIIENGKRISSYTNCSRVTFFTIFVDNFIEDMIIYNDFKNSVQCTRTKLSQTIKNVIEDMLYEVEHSKDNQLIVDNLPYSINTTLIIKKTPSFKKTGIITKSNWC